MTFITLFILFSAVAGLIVSLLAQAASNRSLHEVTTHLVKLRNGSMVSIRRRGKLLARPIRKILIFYCVKERINDKCPSCGHRKGKIQCDIYNRFIAHTCAICGAEWGRPFVRASEEWLAVHTPPVPPAKASADAVR